MFTWEWTDSKQITRTFSDPVVFCRVREPWGGLSNMSNEYPLCVNDIAVPSSEALYQALRFPHQPDWQLEILTAPHAMQAKMVAKKGGRRANHSRTDWDAIRVDVMHWVLRVKLAQHEQTFGDLLAATGERPIVEFSKHDDFWGARSDPEEPTRLVGTNMLGQLLIQLRDEMLATENHGLPVVAPPHIPEFLLLGEEIRGINAAPRHVKNLLLKASLP
jgi:ribA/ribD-fused uncharacterized protein